MHEGQQKGGITHVQFTPDGTKLLAGGRKDKEILVWDLRNPGKSLTLLLMMSGHFSMPSTIFLTLKCVLLSIAVSFADL